MQCGARTASDRVPQPSAALGGSARRARRSGRAASSCGTPSHEGRQHALGGARAACGGWYSARDSGRLRSDSSSRRDRAGGNPEARREPPRPSRAWHAWFGAAHLHRDLGSLRLEWSEGSGGRCAGGLFCPCSRQAAGALASGRAAPSLSALWTVPDSDELRRRPGFRSGVPASAGLRSGKRYIGSAQRCRMASSAHPVESGITHPLVESAQSRARANAPLATRCAASSGLARIIWPG